MTRSLLSLLALALVLTACDSSAPLPTSEVTVGATYDASTFVFRDADSGRPVLDFLAMGTTMSIEFTDNDSFEATVFVPASALTASGAEDDIEGDFEERITGTFRQVEGALTFTADPWVDSFVEAEGWTIDADGGAIRFTDAEDDFAIDLVLTRR